MTFSWVAVNFRLLIVSAVFQVCLGKFISHTFDQSNFQLSFNYINYADENEENLADNNGSLLEEDVSSVIEGCKYNINVYDTGKGGSYSTCEHLVHKSMTDRVDVPMQLILVGALSHLLNFSCEIRSTQSEEYQGSNVNQSVHLKLKIPYIAISLTIPGAKIPEGANITQFFGDSFYSFAVGLPRSTVALTTSLKPFQWSVWLLLLALFLPVAAIATLILNKHPSIQKEIFLFHREEELRSRMSFKCVSFYLFRSLVLQDKFYGKIVSLSSLTCLIASWQFFSTLMCTSYTSRLFGIISKPDLTVVPTTWEELANSSYRMGTPNIYQASNVLKEKDGKIHSRCKNCKNIGEPSRLTFYPIDECIGNATVSTDFACIVPYNRLIVKSLQLYVTSDGNPLVKISTDNYIPVFRLWIYKLGKIEMNLTSSIQHLYEAGVLLHWEKSYYRKLLREGLSKAQAKSINETWINFPNGSAIIERSRERQPGFKTLKLENVAGLMIIWIIGLFTSVLAFLNEYSVTMHSIPKDV